MKATIGFLIGLVFSVPAGAGPHVEGRVLLPSGEPAVGAQVRLFDLAELGAPAAGGHHGPVGAFHPAVGNPCGAPAGGLRDGFELPQSVQPLHRHPVSTAGPDAGAVGGIQPPGQRIATLVDEEQPAGLHTAEWDATDESGQAVGAGVYLYRLSGDGVQATRSMLLIDGQAGIPSGGNGSTAMGGEAGAGDDGKTAPVHGLTVWVSGLIPYVDPAFRVEAGMAPLDLVVEAPGSASSAKVASGGILGDVDKNCLIGLIGSWGHAGAEPGRGSGAKPAASSGRATASGPAINT